jgi:hypothetical protein
MTTPPPGPPAVVAVVAVGHAVDCDVCALFGLPAWHANEADQLADPRPPPPPRPAHRHRPPLLTGRTPAMTTPQLPGPDPGLARRVTRLARLDPGAVAAVYAAGEANGSAEAEQYMAAAWRPVAAFIRATADTPSHAELQRLRAATPPTPKGAA